MPSAEAPTSGRVISKVASAFEERPVDSPGARSLELALELLVAAQQVVHRHAAVLEDELGGLRRADAELRLLLAHRETGGVPRYDERRVAAVAEILVDGCDDDGHVGDAAVRDEDLGAVQDPLVAVEHGRGAQRAHVRPGARLRDRVGAELYLIALAEALGDPAGDLLGGAGRRDPRRGERAARDRERNAGTAVVQLLGVDAAHDPVGIGADLRDLVHAMEAPLACGPDDVPRRALVTVVLRRDGPDDLLGEPAAGPLELELFVVEPEIHWNRCLHGC